MTSVTPISLQLYTVRELLANDLEGVLTKVAEIGYAGAEPWGGLDFGVAAPLLKSLGVTVHSMHSALPVGDDKAKVLEMAQAYGVKQIVCPYLPPDAFASEDAVKATADKLNEANSVATSEGFQLGYHNHDHEFVDIGGRPAYTLLRELTDDSIVLEVDTYWVKVGGYDPAALVKELGARSPLLHIKDGPGTRHDAMFAVGDGVMDVPAVIAAGQGFTEWLIVELDKCDTDMMEAVAKSYQYLTGEGLARGR